MDIKQIVQEIAQVIECSANFSIHMSDHKCCELLLATLSNELGEVKKTLHIGAVSAPASIPFELVRLNLRLNNLVSITVIRDALRVALEPYLVSRRLHLVMHDTLEGLEIVLIANDGKIQTFHDVSSASLCVDSMKFVSDNTKYEQDGH
jgi:hypothetical protein